MKSYIVSAVVALLMLGSGFNGNAATIGLTLPGTGVLIDPCFTDSFSSAVTSCSTTLASDLQSGYGTPAQTSFSGPWTATNASGNLTATTTASPGVLNDSVTSTPTSAAYPVTGIFGEAASFVEDTLTISDPSLNGMSGSLVLGAFVDGTGSGSNFNSNGIGAGPAFSVYAGTPLEGFPPVTEFIATNVSTSYLGQSIPFIYGQPFGIEFYFEATAGAFCESVGACSPWTGLPISSTATGAAVLDSLTVYDSNGNILPSADWSAVSGSGVEYTATGVVPEPSYNLILLAAGIGLVFRRIRMAR